MVVTNAADGNAQHAPTTAERLAALWRTQGHWLYVLIPLSLILIRPLRWCWGSWLSFDSPLVFQPFLPFLAAWLIWERRGELQEISDEISLVFGADSPKRRGKLWPVLLSCVILVIAALAMVPSLAMLAFVGIVVGIVYYLYGPTILKALWQPLLLLVLMVPPPGIILGTFSAVLQTVTARIVGALLHLFVGDVRTVGNFIFMPTTPFPIGPSLGGPSVALPTMALTLWWAFRKNVRPHQYGHSAVDCARRLPAFQRDSDVFHWPYRRLEPGTRAKPDPYSVVAADSSRLLCYDPNRRILHAQARP